MNQKIVTKSIVFIFLFSFIFIQGCVGKSRYRAELSKNEVLAAQLKSQAKEKARLEQEKHDIKKQLEASHQQAGFREKEQAKLINAQADQISLLEVRENKHTQEKKRLEDERKSLKGMLSEAEKVAEEKVRNAQEAIRARESLINSLQTEIDQGNVKISQMNDRLSVQIVSKILFSSGSDQVTGEGKGVLKKVSLSLKNLTKNKIRIEGHTDNVPIGPVLARKFPSNWELSTARATQVVRYLSQEEVNPKNLLAVGMAEHTPIASNDSPEGRQKNRRIEIVLTPK
ncbi:MAG: OmpA family protein [Nitrospirota bacterium]|nr:OmpA family protein [Nitrospirota bacterium]